MVVGFADIHNHQFAEWGFGGRLFHGRAYGDPKDALRHCNEVHGPGGLKDVISNLMRSVVYGQLPLGHAVGGYPEFDGWPKWDSVSHQTVHEDWLKRAVDGGLRLMVMLAVNSEFVAKTAGLSGMSKGRTSHDMEAVDYQLQEAWNMQDYIDAKSGGPGQGWYRIVTTPEQARRVMDAGKLAVVLGIEVDYLFNSYRNPDWSDPLDEKRMVTALESYYARGVRHLFPIHFDNNAFGGASFDKTPIQHDIEIERYGDPLFSPYRFTTEDGSQFGYEAKGKRVNAEGLTDLGRALIRELMTRGMIIEIDHMSRKSRTEVFDIAETIGYPLCSGHTGFVEISAGEKRHEGNLTGDEVDRLRDLGGLLSIIPLQGGLDTIKTWTGGPHLIQHLSGHSSNTLLQAYQYAITKMRGRPVAFGTDFNGFAGVPRGRFPTEVEKQLAVAFGGSPAFVPDNPLGYPFANPVDGTDMPMQRTGDRDWDFNFDGLAHMGLLPDLIGDFKAQGLTDQDLEPLLSSAEGYVRMWERALATTPPARAAAEAAALSVIL